VLVVVAVVILDSSVVNLVANEPDTVSNSESVAYVFPKLLIVVFTLSILPANEPDTVVNDC